MVVMSNITSDEVQTVCLFICMLFVFLLHYLQWDTGMIFLKVF